MGPTLNKRMRAVLAVLEQAAGIGGTARISAPTVSRKTGYSISTARLALRELRDLGAIWHSGDPGRRGPLMRLTGTPFPDHGLQTEVAQEIKNQPRNDGFGFSINLTIQEQKCLLNLIIPVSRVHSVYNILLTYSTEDTQSKERKKENPQTPFEIPEQLAPALVSSSQQPLLTKRTNARFFPAPITAKAEAAPDLFGAPAVLRGGDLAAMMVSIWNECQEQKRGFWTDYIRRQNPAKISRSMGDRMLRCWQENNLNLSIWREVCTACVRSTVLAGMGSQWEGATLSWLIRPDRDNLVDVLSRRWASDFNPARAPGSW